MSENGHFIGIVLFGLAGLFAYIYLLLWASFELDKPELPIWGMIGLLIAGGMYFI